MIYIWDVAKETQMRGEGSFRYFPLFLLEMDDRRRRGKHLQDELVKPSAVPCLCRLSSFSASSITAACLGLGRFLSSFHLSLAIFCKGTSYLYLCLESEGQPATSKGRTASTTAAKCSNLVQGSLLALPSKEQGRRTSSAKLFLPHATSS